MLRVGNALNSQIDARLAHGLDVNDQPAPPLKPSYAKFKLRKGGSGIRDWKLTGRLRGSMKVLSAGPNKVTLGFTDDVANARAFFNNQRTRQYGVSPSDKQTLLAALNGESSPVKAQVA